MGHPTSDDDPGSFVPGNLASEAKARRSGRPSTRRRTSTAIRLDPDLHARLTMAADERDVSVNWLVNRAVARLLDRLIPVDQWKLTTED